MYKKLTGKRIENKGKNNSNSKLNSRFQYLHSQTQSVPGIVNLMVATSLERQVLLCFVDLK